MFYLSNKNPSHPYTFANNSAFKKLFVSMLENGWDYNLAKLIARTSRESDKGITQIFKDPSASISFQLKEIPDKFHTRFSDFLNEKATSFVFPCEVLTSRIIEVNDSLQGHPVISSGNCRGSVIQLLDSFGISITPEITVEDIEDDILHNIRSNKMKGVGSQNVNEFFSWLELESHIRSGMMPTQLGKQTALGYGVCQKIVSLWKMIIKLGIPSSEAKESKFGAYKYAKLDKLAEGGSIEEAIEYLHNPKNIIEKTLSPAEIIKLKKNNADLIKFNYAMDVALRRKKFDINEYRMLDEVAIS